MKTSTATSITLIMTLMGGCASKQVPIPPKGISSQFETRISDSGLKLFKLKTTGRGQHMGRTKSGRNSNKLERWLEYELSRQLSESRFCRSGHTEIERSIGAGFAVIRGECNELEDR